MSARKKKRLQRVAGLRERLETLAAARAAKLAHALEEAVAASTALRDEQHALAQLPLESAAELASRASLLDRSRKALEALEARAEAARSEWAEAQGQAQQARAQTRAVERALERWHEEQRMRAGRAQQQDADEFASRMHARRSEQ